MPFTRDSTGLYSIKDETTDFVSHNQTSPKKSELIADSPQCKKPPFACHLCIRRFYFKHALDAHFQMHKKFMCEICKISFASESRLKIHRFHHADVKPFICEMCNKGFVAKCMLDEHLKTHFIEKPYICEVCGRGYLKKDSLKEHMNNVHLKPFVCEICGKKFSSRNGFKQHLRIHTKEEPYICEVCGKGFAHNQQLYKHILTHNEWRSVYGSVAGFRKVKYL